tara:strand:- start:379 stop:666 length:288 start_codon:yes stop_codon:yes gene_type:complete
MDNENWEAIPDEYKTLNLYMTYGRVDGAIDKEREYTHNFTEEDTLSIIRSTVADFMDEAEGKDRLLIIRWLFCLFEEGEDIDLETGELCRPINLS